MQACPPSAAYRLRFARGTPALFCGRRRSGAAARGHGGEHLAGRARHIRAERKTGEALAQGSPLPTHKRARRSTTLTDEMMQTLFAQQPELEDGKKRRSCARFSPSTKNSRSKRVRPRTRFSSRPAVISRSHISAASLARSAWRRHGYRQATELLEQLLSEFPNVVEYQHKLALTDGNLGILLAKLGKDSDAERSLRRSWSFVRNWSSSPPRK